MPQPQAGSSSSPRRVVSQTTALRRRVAELERELEHHARRRRRMILSVAIGLSVIAHLILILYLSITSRPVPGGSQVRTVQLEFASLDEVDLEDQSSLPDQPLHEQLQQDVSLDALEGEVELALDPSDSRLDMPLADQRDFIGGAGDGSSGEATLGGGGAGTTFFGISGRGTRFAFIADISGSMARFNRMERLREELITAIESLPDFAHFYVVLFSSDVVHPPMQTGWSRASRPTVRRYVGWVNDITPFGGTQPRNAFHDVFGLSPRPDVIFFMTDGEVLGFTADEVAELNRRGKRVVIHTIAFGEPTSQDLLREIAADSGGEYRFVETEPR